MSPAAHQEGPYSFRFFSADYPEPPHVHVRRDRNRAKFWLDPVRLATNKGFSQHELNRIKRIVEDHEAELLEAWHDYFGT